MDAITLGLFASRIEAVCDEMGAVLRRVAFSPNIRDRLDYSCAVFDPEGGLCAQAAHIPVHLGSMAYAMANIVQGIAWQPGDGILVNDPYLGGTHLPDVTFITPVFVADRLMGFVANRAHHADIGAGSPGSMPVSHNLHDEGLVIPPTRIMVKGKVDEKIMQELMAPLRNPRESQGDFSAQISANQRGATRLMELIQRIGTQQYLLSLAALNDYAERLARDSLKQIPDGDYAFEDVMDDDGQGYVAIPIQASLQVRNGRVTVDFSGTASQVKGNINCPLSVAAAAVYYVFRCLMPDQTPACAGSFRCIEITAPEGCLVNAQRPAAVAAGNVETSSRIVDVILGALAGAISTAIPAASQGSMNNIAMGGYASQDRPGWDYYETIGGGMGAGPDHPGLSGVQTHMTNTLNTPVEALEMKYPLRIRQYRLRRHSGGEGRFNGGDGLVREFEFLAPAQATLLTERRSYQPWGIAGGQPGETGLNLLNGKSLPAKVQLQLKTGDRLCIETPGGGGYGYSEEN